MANISKDSFENGIWYANIHLIYADVHLITIYKTLKHHLFDYNQLQ